MYAFRRLLNHTVRYLLIALKGRLMYGKRYEVRARYQLMILRNFTRSKIIYTPHTVLNRARFYSSRKRV